MKKLVIALAASMIVGCSGGNTSSPEIPTAPSPTPTPTPTPVPPPTPQTYVAKVSWDPVTTKTDGSILSDLAGYRVYYSPKSCNDSMAEHVSVPGTITAVTINVTSGTWYFCATAVDAAGLESAFSDEVSKTW